MESNEDNLYNRSCSITNMVLNVFDPKIPLFGKEGLGEIL
jgi:hypothetical protein